MSLRFSPFPVLLPLRFSSFLFYFPLSHPQSALGRTAGLRRSSRASSEPVIAPRRVPVSGRVPFRKVRQVLQSRLLELLAAGWRITVCR